MTEKDIIVAENLTKEYNGKTAVNGINFRVRARECFGFLGPNGAGKTTTVNMIYCFSPVTAGRLTVLGLDVREHPREIKSRLGVVPQENNLDPDLRVLQNLLVYASYFRIPAAVARERAMELLAFFDLDDRTQEKVDRLSGGMKRRLTIARALINNPALVILDEPTTGLDPQARHLVWQRLRRLKERGVTLVLTTHYLEEAGQLCDRLVIMDRGEILEEGGPGELLAKHIGREVVEVGGSDTGNRIGANPGQNGPAMASGRDEKATALPARTIEARNEKHQPPSDWETLVLSRVNHLLRGHLMVGDNLFLFPRESGQELLQALQAQPVHFFHLLLRPATLEDVFLKLTGRGLTA
ncbi:ABC transporter ATP-binding protein [Desulfotomaculum copahuensis]|uniref:ABC transporter n=1 Tax=Desulfotomaculum copahuensis TaxID=1838280 RepID=A0A1B7LC59_9FIRM|nr:ABC transporter ATP-binding protein [Desulfotomaculum copahuensis]OAT80302.1 ABC transporter [Desulfotomaculum copahuensis]